jgi:hypothetical protein
MGEIIAWPAVEPHSRLSFRAITRKPSCLISCSHWPPDGSFVVLVGRPVGRNLFAQPHRGRNRTLRDSMSVPQLVFLPRAVIAGNAAIFSPRWTMKAS